MKKNVWICAFATICAGALLAGCGKEKTAPQESQISEPTEVVQVIETETQEPATETHEGEARSPFTGEWIDETVATKRPVAVMTENTKVTLPQYGLGQADIIYECPVEGGITRLMAIYQDYSGMERVGNVRSCRLYYVYFAKEFDAIYFHAGESKYALDVLNSSFIDNVDGITGKGGLYFYRDNSRKAPHNLYTTSDLIASGIENYGFTTTLSDSYGSHYQFVTEEEPNLLTEGVDATKISMYYVDPKPWFEYNSEDGLYYRFEFGAPQKDGLTDQQIAVTNIIIQNCYSTLKDSSNGTLDIDYQSGGTGKFITKGKAIDITWSRESSSSKTKYYDTNGNEIVLNPGTTWVEIVENSKADKNTIN